MTSFFVLIGPPGVGKTALLTAFAGDYVATSRYPGTEVELAEGTVWVEERWARVVDTPGISSLRALGDRERITRELLLSNPRAVAILVANSSRTAEAVLLAVELAEFGIPLVLCLNRLDETSEPGPSDMELSVRLQAPVVSIAAARREGIELLCSALSWAAVPAARVLYPDPIEMAAATIARALGDGPQAHGLALLFLSGDETVQPRIEAAVPAALFRNITDVADALTRHMGLVAPAIGAMRRIVVSQLLRGVAVSAQRTAGGARTGPASAATSLAVWKRFPGRPRRTGDEP